MESRGRRSLMCPRQRHDPKNPCELLQEEWTLEDALDVAVYCEETYDKYAAGYVELSENLNGKREIDLLNPNNYHLISPNIFRVQKFGSLLSQDLKKGSAGLVELLEQEAENGMEERKSLARKLGEEAGTKLLLPMMLMLILVVVILMVPAILAF